MPLERLPVRAGRKSSNTKSPFRYASNAEVNIRNPKRLPRLQCNFRCDIPLTLSISLAVYPPVPKRPRGAVKAPAHGFIRHSLIT